MDISHLCTVKRQHSGTYLPRLPPNPSRCDRFKRTFHTWTAIYKHHPKCIEYFKSATGIRRERKRHMLSPYAYIIHPFSQFRIYYEICMIVIYMGVFLTRCTQYKVLEDSGFSEMLSGVFGTLCLFNVPVTFFTGYAQQSTREVILEPKKIALRYVTSLYLFVDVASFTPLKIFVMSFEEETLLRITICIDIMRLVMIFRLFTVDKYIMNTSMYYGLYNKKFFSLFRYAFMLIVVVHFINVFHFSLPQAYAVRHGLVHQHSWIRTANLSASYSSRYFLTLRMVSGLMLGASGQSADVAVWYETAIDIITLIVGKFYCIFLTVVILHMMMTNRNLWIKYARIKDQLEEYMTYKDLPYAMRKRLRMYYDYKYQGKFIKDTAISNLLSNSLNREIKIHVCRKLVNNVTLFAGLSTHTVSDILEYLKSEIYLPNDTIIKAGDPGDCMYLVSTGTVAVYTPSGKELCHLQDGAYFGEIALIMKDQPRTANVYAVEMCEVYSLDRRRFRQYFMKDQDLYSKMYKKAEDRLDMLTALEDYHSKSKVVKKK